MAVTYVAEDEHDVIEGMQQGYLFSVDMILETFKLTKTQFYDYIYSDVSKLKVSSDLRNRLKLLDLENEYLIFFINRLISTEKSVLFSFDEILFFMVKEGYFSVELYDMKARLYRDITEEYIIQVDDLPSATKLVIQALTYAKKQKEYTEDFINHNKKPSNNKKTLQSRFYSRIKQYSHFRFKILGVYTYSIIQNIGQGVPQYLKFKDENLEIVNEILDLYDL